MATLTDRVVMLGMVNFAAGIPMIVLSMVGGTFADRYSKRNIPLLAQVAYPREIAECGAASGLHSTIISASHVRATWQIFQWCCLDK